LNDSLQFLEYRLKGKDTIYKRQETVDYIVGSGQHTNSHIQSVNGYLNQMPMTFYTQKQKWDLPPGFEDGRNTRFMRKIGLECMSCHNNYPEFVIGSENKFTMLCQKVLIANVVMAQEVFTLHNDKMEVELTHQNILITVL
jgi:hypothetical protein